MPSTDSVNNMYRGQQCFSQATNIGDRTAISWTGGKDCSLALVKALEANLNVVCLVVFCRNTKQKFYAHRFQCQQVQADALNLPLVICPLEESIKLDDNDQQPEKLQPQSNDNNDRCSKDKNNKYTDNPFINYYEAYATAIRQLQKDYDIKWIVTGDIDYVGNAKTNFMQDVCCQYPTNNVQILLPLWQISRSQLLDEMITKYKLDIRYSCVKTPHFDSTWIGKQLNELTLEKIKQISNQTGLDLSGENGEYHTMVLGIPYINNKYYSQKQNDNERKKKRMLMKLQLVDIDIQELLDQPGQPLEEQWWVWSESTKLIHVVDSS